MSTVYHQIYVKFERENIIYFSAGKYFAVSLKSILFRFKFKVNVLHCLLRLIVSFSFQAVLALDPLINPASNNT